MNESVLIDLREAISSIALVVFLLYVWVVYDALAGAISSDSVAKRGLFWRRFQFATGILLSWFSMVGVNVWFLAWAQIGKPAWMVGHPLQIFFVGLAGIAALIHVRVATADRWGEWPWLAVMGFGALMGWVL